MMDYKLERQFLILLLRKLWRARALEVVAKQISKARRTLALKKSIRALLNTPVDLRERLNPIWPHLTGKSVKMRDVGSSFEFRGVVHSFDKVYWFRSPNSSYSFPVKRMDKYSLQKFRFIGIDINYNWQLSRCAHFLVRGQRLNFPQQSNYEFFKTSVTDWTNANPFLFGVNWLCTMDVAIRAINLTVASSFFIDDLERDPDFGNILQVTLTQHAEYIACFPEIGESGYNNNHATAGFTGLLFLALTIPDHAKSRIWLKTALSGLQQCIEYQTYNDGVNFEGSVPYHMLTLECFAYSLLLCTQHGIDIGDDFIKRTFQMFHYANYVIDSNGKIPQIGDNDSARLLYFDLDISQYESILTLGEHLFNYKFDGRCQLRSSITRSLLPEVAKICPPDIESIGHKMSPLKVFEDGGITILSNRLFHAVVCHHGLGQAGKGGHNHVDVGHFVLSYGGEKIIGDPGSYSYNRAKEVRDLFRHPCRHNMMLYHEEKFDLTTSPNFSLPSFFEVEILKHELNSMSAHLTLEITSTNERLARQVDYRLGRDEFLITYTGVMDLPFANYFILHPECDLREHNGTLVVNDNVEIRFDGHDNLSIDIVDYSLVYGQKEPSYRVVTQSKNKLDVRIKIRATRT